MIDPMKVIQFYYPEENDLKRNLLKHSRQVREKTFQLRILNPEMKLDEELLHCGAMLHDIGIGQCHAPDIFCCGKEPYLKHGVIGAEMIREYGRTHGLALEPIARICERHTGSGLTGEEISAGGLPLPPQDFLPETPEEKLICLADKFYSKSGNMQEKSLDKIIRSMERFGQGPLERFYQLCNEFHIIKY